MGFEAEAKRIQDLYLDGHKAEAASVMPTSLVEATSLVGPREKIRDDLEAWRESLVTTLLVGGGIDQMRLLADASAERRRPGRLRNVHRRKDRRAGGIERLPVRHRGPGGRRGALRELGQHVRRDAGRGSVTPAMGPRRERLREDARVRPQPIDERRRARGEHTTTARHRVDRRVGVEQPSTLVIGEWHTIWAFAGDEGPGEYRSNSDPLAKGISAPRPRPVPPRIHDSRSTTTRTRVPTPMAGTPGRPPRSSTTPAGGRGRHPSLRSPRHRPCPGTGPGRRPCSTRPADCPPPARHPAGCGGSRRSPRGTPR